MNKKLLKGLSACFLLAAGGGMGVLMGNLFSDQDIEDSADPVSTARNGDEEKIRQICNSNAPILVLDTFSARQPDFGVRVSRHTMDVNGDGQSDIAHGDYVAKIAELNDRQIITYGIDANERGLDGNSLDQALQDIPRLVEKGDLPHNIVVSMSIIHGLDLTFLNLDLGFYDHNEKELTPNNIADRKDEIIDRLEKVIPELDMAKNEDKRREYLIEVYETYEAVKHLNDVGITLITGAGNDYEPDEINLYALFGGISVGALGYDRTKPTAYTNQNSLTTVYRQGNFVSRQIDGGIDINDDGEIDFRDSDLSSGQSYASIFNGSTIARQYNALENYQSNRERFFSINELEENDYLISAGENSYYDVNLRERYGDYFHGQTRMQYRADRNGQLWYDPANDSSRNQVSFITGTSFATPNICAS